MATVMYIPEKKQSLGAMKGVMDYVCQEKKTRDPVTGQRFVTGVHCLGDNACREFLATKRTYGKTKGVNFYQYVQSFSPKEAVTLEKAHAIALEFAQKAWPGFEVLVATHRDAGHLHSHFVVNSVSWETGRKLRQSPKTLQTLRALSDEICAAQGLSVLPRYEKPGAKLSSREYRAAQRGESWKFQLIITIEEAMKRAGTREEFLREMNQRGYQVRWEDGRKSITYTTPTGKKCRDDKLHELKFRKEQMEHEFRIRQRAAQQLAGRPEAETESIPGHADLDRPADQHPLHHANPNILYTMPIQTVERLEQVLRSTLALQENIRSEMDSLATKKSLEPLATADLLARWLNQTADLHQGMCEDLKKVQHGIQEENRQAGKQRDEFMNRLSTVTEQLRRDGEELQTSFRRWAATTIMCSVAGATAASILVWRILG